MTLNDFQNDIRTGIPQVLPPKKHYEPEINHAPKRKEILSEDEKILALKNALRYFPKDQHAELAAEFKEELEKYGRIYMYRFRPDYKMYARPIDEYPGNSRQAKAIMLMIQNNLDYAVAQHPHELITYGGNGAVLVFLGDVCPTSAHLPLPWIMGYDVEPLVTLESKRRLLTRAVDEGWLLVFEHDASVIWSRIVHDGRAFGVEG